MLTVIACTGFSSFYGTLDVEIIIAFVVGDYSESRTIPRRLFVAIIDIHSDMWLSKGKYFFLFASL